MIEEVEAGDEPDEAIAIDHDGNISLPFNSRVMYRAWMGADGEVRVAVEP